ncbi:putative basic-leucine zipper transcription factor J [Escovopsis weberi]|uniref:Putative basic-leucine zipper transcription factor J n=1 Tax=Escovopsis weberi TaxID=150374 RepID=A0A0N0RSU8_ESCWE|nr:putative basic-leucine zipper transcription factor J [Escovopsis weberi]
MDSYYSTTPLALYKEEGSVLEDSLLDTSSMDSGLDLSPDLADSRRESFAIGAPLFSPKTEDWHSVDMQSLPSNNPFYDGSHAATTTATNNPFFMRFDQAATANPYVSAANPWAMNSTSSTPTPFQRFENIPADFETNATSIFQRNIHAPTPFANTGNMFSALTAESHAMEASESSPGGPAAKKMRPSSPTIRSHNDLRRGDGIRKKNARFEIPAERNLSNIDQLIAQSTDEQEIKELKQQKRLLRNRQAALDSRQRKKLHTERLEDEKKHFTAAITDMEEELNSLKAKMEELVLEKQSYVNYIDALTNEKDEMIRAHTNETGELRKKVSVLTEHVQRLESNAMPAAASSGNGYGAFGDMDDAMDMGAWDNNGFLHDFDHDVKPTMPMAHPKKDNNPFTQEAEKSASQGGLLFMLFLVGAFVLSSRSTPALPRVSEDMRVASASLLDSVFKDAGISTQAGAMTLAAPQPSGVSWMGATPTGMIMDSVAPSMLADLGDNLINPTEEQTNEQLFGLSAAQYNGINDQDFLHNAPQRVPSKGRRNLAQALADLQAATKQTGAAEVYTRSLLWDQIPSDVVRNFAKMVAECNHAQAAH